MKMSSSSSQFLFPPLRDIFCAVIPRGDITVRFWLILSVFILVNHPLLPCLARATSGFSNPPNRMEVVAMCASLCFRLQFEEATPESQKFLHDHPQLAMPFCENKTANCLSCLHGCSTGSRLTTSTSQTSDCSQLCQGAGAAPPHLHSVLQSSTCTYATVLPEPVNNDPPPVPVPNRSSGCLQGCHFAHLRSRHSSPGLCPPTAPSASCPVGPPCQEDSQCQQQSFGEATLSKCCSTELLGCGSARCVPALLHSPDLPPSLNRFTATQHSEVVTEGGQKRVQFNVELNWDEYRSLKGRSDPRSISSELGAAFQHLVFLVQIQMALTNPAVSNRPLTWQNLVWTTKDRALLADLREGAWFRFRVTAFNEHGFQNYGTESSPLHIVQAPSDVPTRRPPSQSLHPPRRLHESRSRIQNQRVALTVEWQPPAIDGKNALPVAKYQITWQQLYGPVGAGQTSMTEFVGRTPESNRSYTMSDLLPDTHYKVQVFAIGVSSEGKEVFSRPAIAYVRTLTVPQATELEGGEQTATSGDTSQGACACEEARQHAELFSVGKSYFQEGDLRVKLHFVNNSWLADHGRKGLLEVFWSPRVCIESYNEEAVQSRMMAPITNSESLFQRRPLTLTSSPVFVVSGLRFQCHYRLEVRLLRPRQAWESCFCTPSCHDVHSLDDSRKPAGCVPGEEVPPTPLDLRYQILIPEPTPVAVGFDVLLHWDSTLSSSGSWNTENTQQQHNFRLRWGPRVDEPVEEMMYNFGLEPRMDTRLSESKVLPGTSRSFRIKSLSAGKLYIVELQTISLTGESPYKMVFFTLPPTQRDKATDMTTPTTSLQPKGNNECRSSHFTGHIYWLTSILLVLLGTL